MEDWQIEFENFFNPEDLSAWANRSPEEVIAIISSELKTPIEVIRGYTDVLSMEPIAEQVALVSKDGEAKTLGEILEIVEKSAYMIYRMRETLLAYSAAYGAQNYDDQA